MVEFFWETKSVYNTLSGDVIEEGVIILFLDDKLWKCWLLSTVREHPEHFAVLVSQNGQIWKLLLCQLFFPCCCTVGGAVSSMSSIWVIVECFVVVNYLLSLNVCTVTLLIAYVLFSTSVKLFSHRTSLMLAVWSAIMASTFCSVLPLTLRVDCFPMDNTLALTFIAWKSEMSPMSLMENVWENVIVRNCRWCYARLFLYNVFLLRCTAPLQ